MRAKKVYESMTDLLNGKTQKVEDEMKKHLGHSFVKLEKKAKEGIVDKTISEAIGDILKPKSKKELKQVLDNLKDPYDLLIYATDFGFVNYVKKAVKRGADVHAFNDYPLRMASMKGFYNIAKYLIEKGANVYSAHNSPLQLASEHGHIKIVKLLLDNGVDVHAENDRALRWASENGHVEVVKVLKKYM